MLWIIAIWYDAVNATKCLPTSIANTEFPFVCLEFSHFTDVMTQREIHRAATAAASTAATTTTKTNLKIKLIQCTIYECIAAVWLGMEKWMTRKWCIFTALFSVKYRFTLNRMWVDVCVCFLCGVLGKCGKRFLFILGFLYKSSLIISESVWCLSFA